MILSSLFFGLKAQNPLAEVQGRISVYLSNDTTSVHIGRKAGFSQNLNFRLFNTFVGSNAGEFSDLGSENSFFGDRAGRSNRSGTRNSYFGTGAGMFNEGGLSNCFVGYLSGAQSAGDANTFYGAYSGSESSGDYNVFMGGASGMFNRGKHNTSLGSFSFASGDSGGSYNTAIGDSSMFLIDTDGDIQGHNNTAVGASSLFAKSNLDTENSVAVGYQSGYHGGSRSVFIGYQAGKSAQQLIDRLYISNQAGDSPLIYGEFDNSLIRVNGDLEGTGKVGINVADPVSQLTIKQSSTGDSTGIRLIDDGNNESWEIRNGGSNRDLRFRAFGNDGTTVDMTVEIHRADGSYHIHSDKRLKRDITQLSHILSQVVRINPAAYQWVDQPDQEHPSLGVIAQELEAIFPSIVSTNEDGYKMVNYDALGVLAIQAIKEQQAIIESQQKQIDQILSMIGASSH